MTNSNMRFSPPLTEGRLIRRYKRFLADVELATGEAVTAHVANPGAMLGLTQQGMRVFLSKSASVTRKLPWSLELVDADGVLVGINTSHPNGLVADAIGDQAIAELAGYDHLRREVAYGTNSRIDILLSSAGKPDAYVEIKNVHFSREKGRAEFPDSPTARGTKHLGELAAMVKDGKRAAMLYLVQRSDTTSFALARDVDPIYGTAFDAAHAAGVEMFAYQCSITSEEIAITTRLPVLG
jgi:sugar fermentation stimulation protein A